MSLSLEPVEPQSDEVELVEAPTRQRWLRPVLIVILVLVIALVLFLAWLAAGLKKASADIKAPAALARTELTTMKTALTNGDQDTAATALAAAHSNVLAASAAADRAPVRIAAGLPVLSGPVSDLRHLLSAAKDLTSGGDRVLALYKNISGKDSKLFQNSTFDLAEVHSAGDSVRELMGLLDKAELELKQVRGGRFAEGATEARDSALVQLTSLRKDAKPLVDIFGVLPKALGEQSKQCYLVTLQNQAELRPGGGAPLSLTEICFDKGGMSLLPTRATVDIDKNKPIQWAAVKGNEAWHKPGKAQPFASANFAPDWPTSGEELLRAYGVMSGGKTDGVIGIDVTAMAAVLKSTGTSLTTTDYGTVTSETLAQKLLIDAYRDFDTPTRRKNNGEVMSAMVSKLIGGGGLAGKFRALAGTAPGHHVQMYFRDADLQKLVQPTAMAGRLDPGVGDFAAVYTTNTNASKVDVYQARTVTQDVVIAADGSALVNRAVTISNNSPGYIPTALYPRDPNSGYGTTISRPALATYLPPGAKVRGFAVTGSVNARPEVRPYANDKGMRVMRAYAYLPPRQSLMAKTTYLTRAPAAVDGYRLRIASQATLLPMQMTVAVTVPTGFTVKPTPGWALVGGRWTTTLSVTGDIDIFLPFTRG